MEGAMRSIGRDPGGAAEELVVNTGISSYRKITLWVEHVDAALSGAVEWYEDFERVEALAVAAGPFETAAELLQTLLRETRL